MDAKAKKRLYDIEYRKKNKAKRNAQSKQYYHIYKERLAEKKKLYEKANFEHVRAIKQNWQKQYEMNHKIMINGVKYNNKTMKSPILDMLIDLRNHKQNINFILRKIT